MGQEIQKYKATDGQEITLTPQDVRKYIVTGGGNVPDKEVVSFMAKCAARGLNPYAGDAYLVCYGNKSNVIVSKDYFVRAANQQPNFDGMEAGVVVVNTQGQLVKREGSIVLKGEQLAGGWAKVYRKDVSHPTTAEVAFGEYNTGKSLWTSKPATMIRKVALVQALREAYPTAYAGIYDADEMPAEYSVDMKAEPAQKAPQKPKKTAKAKAQAPQAAQPDNSQAKNEMRKVFKNYRDGLGLDSGEAYRQVFEHLGITDNSQLTDELAWEAVKWMGAAILKNSALAQGQDLVVEDVPPEEVEFIENGIEFGE